MILRFGSVIAQYNSHFKVWMVIRWIEHNEMEFGGEHFLWGPLQKRQEKINLVAPIYRQIYEQWHVPEIRDFERVGLKNNTNLFRFF